MSDPRSQVRLRFALELFAWLALLVSAPLGATLWGAGGPLRVSLNMGPGDEPYVTGFWPHYEIDDRVATHWTTYDAQVEWPIEVSGPLQVSFRYARMLPQTAEVDVFFDGARFDHFSCRGGLVEERSSELVAQPETPLRVRYRIDSHDRLDKGLRLHGLEVGLREGGRVRLRGAARWRAALLVALVFLLFTLAGWQPKWAAAIVAPLAGALMVGMLANPWWMHRLLTGIPEALGLGGAAALGFGVWSRRRQYVSLETFRLVFSICVMAFIVRAVMINHPDFYYPDLRTHVRLAQFVRDAGFDFLRAPARYISEHGVWEVEAHGRRYAFPYSPAFHLPFAWAGTSYDATMTAMKLAGAFLSVIPIALAWALARTLGVSVVGAVLLVAIPTYTSRLSYAFLPSLFGHVFDLGLLLWLSVRLQRIEQRGTWLRCAAWVAAAQLAYVSGTLNISLLMLSLAVIEPVFLSPYRVHRAALILGAGVAGSLLSVLIYYRGFLDVVWDIVPRALGDGGAGTASRYEVRGLIDVASARIGSFFGVLYPVLAVVALWRFFRQRAHVHERGLVAAWCVTFAVLLFGRAKWPDIFAHGHETLLLTPLICLMAGDTLAWLHARGGTSRVAAWGLGGALVVQGSWLQWSALAAQLGNAL